ENEILRIEQTESQLVADDKFNSGQWDGNAWREDYASRQQEYYLRRDANKELLKMEFKDRPITSKIDKAINDYFDVNLEEDYKNDDGTYDWEGYFGAQEDALSPLPFLDRKRIMNKIVNKYDTPTIQKFRKTKETLNEFYDTSAFYGLSVEMSESIKTLTDPDGPVLKGARDPQIIEGEETPSDYFDILMTLSNELHEQGDFKGADIAFYAAYSTRESEARDLMNKHLEQGNTKEAAIMAGLIEGNPERDKLIMNNLELLKFYPDLKEQLSEKEQAYLSVGKPQPGRDRFDFTEEFVSTLPEIFQRGQYTNKAETEVIDRAKIRGTDYGVPKYRYLSIEQGHQVDELVDKVTDLLRQARDQGQRNVPSQREYLASILDKLDRSDPMYDIVAVAFLLKTDARESVYTPEALVDPSMVTDIYLEEQRKEREETEGLLPPELRETELPPLGR
ncbi:unnamed protein product, partial [marine sediment metagenome]